MAVANVIRTVEASAFYTVHCMWGDRHSTEERKGDLQFISEATSCLVQAAGLKIFPVLVTSDRLDSSMT